MNIGNDISLLFKKNLTCTTSSKADLPDNLVWD